MKIKLVNVITKVSLLSAMVFITSVAPAQAQSLVYRIRANIPFDFNVGDKKLPAGRYSIGRARQTSDDTILSIADAQGRSKAIRSSSSASTLQARNKSMLVFHRYGEQYFLYQVWPAGETSGREFLKSRSEREVQQNQAAISSIGKTAKVQFETVTIVGGLQ